MTDTKAEAVLSFLQQEAARYDTNVRAILFQIYQFGALAFTILGTAGTLLADKGLYAVLLIIPSLGLVVWLMGLRALTELFALAAHREFFERQIQTLLTALGYPSIFVRWGHAGGYITVSSPVNIATFAAFALLEVATAVGCFTASWHLLPGYHSWILTDILLCCIVGAFEAWLSQQVLQTYNQTLRRIEADK